jgi:small subunit ribosomal protein S16
VAALAIFSDNYLYIKFYFGGENTMVKIRLKRMGAKKTPFYRIVVADSRYPRDGRFIDQIGTYNPLTDPSTINVDNEKALKWLCQGAQPTDTVKELLKVSGVIK